MKKLFFFLAALTLSFTAHAAVVNIDPSSEGNLRRGIRDKVQAGDTLVLADGEYDESQSVTLDKEGLVIMAADGAKPVIKAKSYMKHYATTTIIGITFDGGGTAAHGFYSYENTNKSLTLIDCEIGNYAEYLINANKSAHIDSLIIEGCLLHDCGDAAVYMTNTDVLPDGLPICSYFKMTNSTIYNINGEQYYGAIDIRENKSAYGAGGTEVIVDHVTLYNYKNPQGGFYIYKSPKLTITNTIVANPTEGPAAFYIYGGTVDNSLYFNGSADSRGTYTECIAEQDPLFMDPTNGNFNLQPGSPVIGKATDGTNMGDPRWKVAAAELAFAMAAPAADVEATDLYTIKWTVLDPDGDATIKLEYKTEEGDWTLIEENIPTTKSAYDWNIRKMAAQTVALRGTLTNATETIESVAAGKLTIVPEAVAPRPVRNLAGEVAENTLTLTWINPDQAYEVSNTLETLEGAESYISNDGTAEVTLSGDKKEVSVAYNTTAAWHMAGIKVPVTADYVNTLACELKRDAADGTQIQVTIEQNGFDWWYLIINDIATEWTEYEFTEFEKLSWHNNSDAAVLDGTNVTAVYFATNHGSGVTGTLSLRNLTLNGAVPAVADYAKTVICVSEEAYPTTIVAEEVVYEGTASTCTVEIDPTKDLYVSVFAQDDLGNTSVAAQYKYTAPAVEEPEGIEVVLENAYKEVYLMWNRANFFGEHATYGEISVQINNYNGYGTYAEGVSSRIDGVKVNGSATFENKGETDLLTATLTDAEGTVYIVKAEVPTPKTYEVVATNAAYVNVDQGWAVVLTVNGLTVGEEELTLTVYWDGVGGSEEGYEATAGFEGSIQGMIFVDKGEDDVLSFEGELKDASDNSYIFDFTATPKAPETYTLTFEDMVIEPDSWSTNLNISAENEDYAIEFKLFNGQTKGYGEYGFTDDEPDVYEIYINYEDATMLEGTVANYYLNEETSLATIELTVVLGIDIYNITLTGQPLVNPEDIEPTDTINITMTEGTIGVVYGMPKVAASSEEAELSIVLVGGDPYAGVTTKDFAVSSYLVTAAGELTFLRGGLEIVEVGDVLIAYIGVLCSDHKWYNITLSTGTELPSALENLDTTVAPAKAIVNGQLVIIKNGVQYNAQGAVVK